MINRRAPGAALRQLEGWYRTPLGRRLAASEADCLERMLRDTFGYQLLQIGFIEALDDVLSGSRIRHRTLLLDAMPGYRARETQRAHIIVEPCRLPVATDSIDAVVLPHVLEFAADAHQVLRETERVLIPEGRVILLGFNSLSLWGLRRLMTLERRKRVPWCGRFLTPFRVADWLSLLGFDIEIEERLMFGLPWRRALFGRLSLAHTVAYRLWPIFAGVYAVRAVKRVSTMTPLRPSWRERRALLSGRRVVGPSVRLLPPARDGRQAARRRHPALGATRKGI